MRIIAGDYKGRRLYTPAHNDIRPTTDKVKEAIFSILSQEIYGSTVLDLFAGTGNLGLEALSRGADYCFFGDNARGSISLIKKNIEYCKAEDKSTVIAGDFQKVLSMIHTPCDIIFLDPPYQKDMLPGCFEKISEYQVLETDGLLVCEHRKEELLPDELNEFVKVKTRKYGTIVVSIYKLK